MRSKNVNAMCVNCPFFYNENEQLGVCKRNAPSLGYQAISVWPVVAAQEPACGEHPFFFLEEQPEPRPEPISTIPEGKTSMGRKKVPCPECGGDGNITGPQMHECCQMCNGTGQVKV